MIVGCLEDNPSNEFYKHIGVIFVKTRIFKKLNMIENICFKKNDIKYLYPCHCVSLDARMEKYFKINEVKININWEIACYDKMKRR